MTSAQRLIENAGLKTCLFVWAALVDSTTIVAFDKVSSTELARIFVLSSVVSLFWHDVLFVSALPLTGVPGQGDKSLIECLLFERHLVRALLTVLDC
jgi:hypothetical protein